MTDRSLYYLNLKCNKISSAQTFLHEKMFGFFLSNKYLDFYNKVQCKYQQSILISLHDQIYVIEKIEHLLEIWPTNLIWGAQEAKETHTKKDIPNHTMLGRRQA